MYHEWSILDTFYMCLVLHIQIQNIQNGRQIFFRGDLTIQLPVIQMRFTPVLKKNPYVLGTKTKLQECYIFVVNIWILFCLTTIKTAKKNIFNLICTSSDCFTHFSSGQNKKKK